MKISGLENTLILIRGAGDMATGTAWVLHKAGFPVIMLEIPNPSAIRRRVAFSEAIFDRTFTLEGVSCLLAKTPEESKHFAMNGQLSVLIDPELKSLETIRPVILIDAILAKRNLGTRKDMADFVIALGPGFTAGHDVHCVIETMRGHSLGRLIYDGTAMANTGIPGQIAGAGKERVIHAPAAGKLTLKHDIGDIVDKETILAVIDTSEGPVPVKATISGVLRGIIRNGFIVSKGLKIADIDPRLTEQKNCYTISDKSRAIGGSVLTAVMTYLSGRQ